jgi:hypothetical protein
MSGAFTRELTAVLEDLKAGIDNPRTGVEGTAKAG